MVRRATVCVVVVIALGALASCSSSDSGPAKSGAGTGSSSSSSSSVATTSTTGPTPVPTTVAFTRAKTPMVPSSTTYVFALMSGGRKRSYRLHVPPAAAAGKALPLVLNLHGATQNALLQEAQSGMDASADRHGYLVAYPDGTRIATKLDPDPVAKQAQYGFNAGACCGLPVDKHVDDVGFLLAVISNVATRTPVDLRRVYVTGMSNGGMMAYAMAAQASTYIAAIASVAGQVEQLGVAPTQPVPTMEFHSVDDPIALYAGVQNNDPKLRYSVIAGVQQWVKADGCDSTPHPDKTIVGTGTSEGLTATLGTYSGCNAGAQVALWQL
ncbi:MAG: polyhydroxybutyrate depolymerase, partial [Actinomycetota bacterium]|nr:polyhydroxybutyrate depolymerase [Actinomycetota bacterium]